VRLVAALQRVERAMSSDALKRAAQLLEGSDRGAARNPPSLPAQSKKGAELMASAEAALAGSVKRAMPPMPATTPRIERVRLPMTCSARGRTYIVIAERHGDTLRFVGHEMPQGGNGPGSTDQLLGHYCIDESSWACPFCSSARGVWICECPRMDGAMHCMGTSGGRQYCACGRFEEHEFIDVEKIAVRGSSVAETPKSSASAMRIQSSAKRVTHG
jgi:hypothetical protein